MSVAWLWMVCVHLTVQRLRVAEACCLCCALAWRHRLATLVSACVTGLAGCRQAAAGATTAQLQAAGARVRPAAALVQRCRGLFVQRVTAPVERARLPSRCANLLLPLALCRVLLILGGVATLALGVFAFVVSACSGSFQDMHDHFPAPPAITNTSAYASSLM